MKPEHALYLAFILLALLGCCSLWKQQEACHAKGGVMVREPLGYTCFEVKR